MSANIMATSRDSGKSLAFTVRLVSSMMTVTTCGRTSGPRKRNGSLRMCSNMPVRCTPGPRKQSKSTLEKEKKTKPILRLALSLLTCSRCLPDATAIVNHAITDNHLNPQSTVWHVSEVDDLASSMAKTFIDSDQPASGTV